jgi:hypothetical protein
MNIIKILKIVISDKIHKTNGRNKRVAEVNHLLRLCSSYETEPFITNNNKFIVEYKRPQFWYDNQPITINNILNKFKYWHVEHWLVYPNGGRCGFATGMVDGMFTKKNIYNWLKKESKRIDKW